MPIDQKKIEEWRAAYLRVVGTMAESPDVARIVAEAFPALLAEREELLRAVGRRREPVECQKCGNTEGFGVTWHPTPGISQSAWFCPHCWAKERAEREEMLALLREARKALEDSGDYLCGEFCSTGPDGSGPHHLAHEPVRSILTRLAAFLGRK